MKAVKKIIVVSLVILLETITCQIAVGNCVLPATKMRLINSDLFTAEKISFDGKAELIDELLTLYKKIDSLPYFICSGSIEQNNSELQSNNRCHNFLYCKNGTGHYFDTEETEILKLQELQLRVNRKAKSLELLPVRSAFPDLRIGSDILKLLLNQKNVAVGKVLVDGIVTLAILGSIGEARYDIVVKYDPDAVMLKSISFHKVISRADKAIELSTRISIDSWQQRKPPEVLFSIRNYFGDYPVSMNPSDKLSDYLFTDRRLEDNQLPAFDLFQCLSGSL